MPWITAWQGVSDADEQFWSAVEHANEELKTTGLYLTHLFTDSQVILRPAWLESIVPIQLGSLQFLRLFRPATEDLILTKMMRVDPQDREDLRFLLQQPDRNHASLQETLDTARVPDVPEIREAFGQNRQWLLAGFGD